MDMNTMLKSTMVEGYAVPFWIMQFAVPTGFQVITVIEQDDDASLLATRNVLCATQAEADELFNRLALEDCTV